MTSEAAGHAQLAPSPLAVALAPMTEVWRDLLATHVPDREGRCSECRWQTRAADRWPCDLYVVADAAKRLTAAQQGFGR